MMEVLKGQSMAPVVSCVSVFVYPMVYSQCHIGDDGDDGVLILKKFQSEKLVKPIESPLASECRKKFIITAWLSS